VKEEIIQELKKIKQKVEKAFSPKPDKGPTSEAPRQSSPGELPGTISPVELPGTRSPVEPAGPARTELPEPRLPKGDSQNSFNPSLEVPKGESQSTFDPLGEAPKLPKGESHSILNPSLEGLPKSQNKGSPNPSAGECPQENLGDFSGV